MNTRLLAVCCTLWVGGAVAASDSPGELTLAWVEDQARTRNPRIASARAQTGAAQEQAPQAGALDPPSLYTMFWAIPQDTPNPGSANEIWVGAKQQFPYPGKRDLRGRVADRAAQILAQQAAGVEAEVIRQARLAYYDLYLAHKELEVTRDHLGLARQFARTAEARYASGAGGQADVLKALVEVADLGNRERVLVRSLRPAEASLNTLLDRAPDAALGKPVEFQASPLLAPLGDLQATALMARSERRAADLEVGRRQVAIELAERERYPDFMTDLSYWNVRDRPNRWMLMVEARVPIAFWSKGRYDARERQARLEERAARASLEELDNQILLAVEKAYTAAEIAAGDMRLYQQPILPQARQAVAALTTAYETDQGTYLNLVDSQRRLLQFELSFHRARVRYEQSVADLERAVGVPPYFEESSR